MELLAHLEPWWRFGGALLIGALIGLEREFVWQRTGDPEFAGIRTFPLISLLGAVAAFLSDQFGILIFVVAYVGLVMLIWASYHGEIAHGHEAGITTEITALLMPFLGAMMIWGYAGLAAALSVIIALLLAMRPALHGLASRMKPADLRVTLEFALISAVVLPLLPDERFGPFVIFNLRQIWLLVVLVSGISFLGYVLMKWIGAERGLSVTGLLGGLVSSTAVTLSFSRRAKEAPDLSYAYGVAILLASSVLLPRVLVEILAVNPSLLAMVALPIGAMLASGLVAVVLARRSKRAEAATVEQAVAVENPLKLTSAIAFGLLFALVLMVVRTASEFAGDIGVYAASFFTGLVDVDAITLTASDLAAKGQMEPGLAANSILVAVIVNSAMKGGIAAVLGGPRLRRLVLLGFGLMVGVGIATSLLGLSMRP
jgi:uncharacterized membrane protein (DUF4010 family)